MAASLPARLLVALLATATLACGPTEEEVRAARREAAEKKAAQQRRQAGREHFQRAFSLALEKKYGQAWAAWRAARDILGETPELTRLADQIREAEARLRMEEAYRDLKRLLDRDRTAKTEEVRLKCLREAARAAEDFLKAYPDHPEAEEIRAALDYDRSELALAERFLSMLEEGRSLLSAGKAKECIATCRAALSMKDSPEARELIVNAQRALAPEGMVLIPEGMFPFGKAKERTYLPAFYVDVHEVTNAQYARFAKEVGVEPPKHFRNGRPPAGKEDHPVVNVSLPDALAYAAWAGKRIPTEVQWERAARGTEGREFPWGEEFDAGKGNFGGGGTVPVGSKPFDRSPDGVFDMGGNVMEMTLPLSDPTGETSGPVLKGGHWSDDFHADYARTWARWPVDRARAAADCGFRCVKPAP